MGITCCRRRRNLQVRRGHRVTFDVRGGNPDIEEALKRAVEHARVGELRDDRLESLHSVEALEQRRQPRRLYRVGGTAPTHKNHARVDSDGRPPNATYVVFE